MNQEQIDQANELRSQQENDSERLNINNRPQADSKIPQFNKELTNSEIAFINKIYHRVNDEKNKTIMDLPLGEIMDNTAHYLNNFMEEYSHYVNDTLINYSDKTDEEMNIMDKIRIYIVAFVRYTFESDNIIYLGILLIIIAIILYFINIIN